MNDEHRPSDCEDLEPQLETIVKAALALPTPEDAVQRVKAKAKRLAATGASPSGDSGSRKRSWKDSRSIATGLTAAAAMVAAIIGGVALWSHTGHEAFAQMLEKVKAIGSVHFTVTTQFGWGPETTSAMYLEGNRLRQEQADGSLIAVLDFDRKQALFLDTHRKIAQSADLDAKLASGFANPIDQLRRCAVERRGSDRRGDSRRASHSRLSTSQGRPARHPGRRGDVGVG